MNSNQKFLESLNKLNQAQRQAVDAVEGSVMVVAGPGTGKTQILTLRIANILLKTDVNPENILALTFTESGVYAMRKRLVSIIGTPGYRVNIYTFHGFCNDLIQDNPEAFPHLLSSEAATELDQIAIVEDFIRNSEEIRILRPFGDPFYYVKPAIAAISDLKKEGITIEKFAEALAKEEADFETLTDLYHEKGPYKGRMKSVYEKQQKHLEKNKELLLVYRAYQEGLQARHFYDFNDMLLEVIVMMERDADFLLRLQEQYQYFLVDEHQDTNAAQNRIVELLCNYYDNPNLFVVGDEKQAIYRFQGASLENFLYFKKLYPEALLVHLTENYRSTQTILDASGSLMGVQNSEFRIQNEKEVEPNYVRLIARAGHREERVKVVEAKDFYSEYYVIGEEVKKKLAEGTVGSEIAILGKENKDLLPFVDVFERLDIPYAIESNQNLLADVAIQKLILLFRTVMHFGADEYLIRAMHIDCLQIHPVEIYRLMQVAKEKRISVWELLQKGELDSGLEPSEKIVEFYRLLLRWKKISYNERFDFLFKSVVDESGFLRSILAKKNAMLTLDKVTALYEEVKSQIERKPDFGLDDFIAYLHLIETHEIQISKATKTIRKDAVRLMTAHRSKGLEFDYVYVIQVFDGHWGNSRKKGSSFRLNWEYLGIQNSESRIQRSKGVMEEKNEALEDERRLFYVALTRARKEAILSFSSYGRDGKDQVASQFLTEILEAYRESLDIRVFENEFLANKQIILTPVDSTVMDLTKEYLAHKEYFNELFRKKGFAVTHLNNYMKCPWRYFFRDLIAIPEPMEKVAIYGSAIHRALNFYLVRNKKSEIKNQSQGVLFEDLVVEKPKDVYGDGLAFLITSFDKALADYPLRKQDMEELLKKGKKALTGYYATYMTEWKDNFKGEFAVRGIHLSDDVMLTGRIDMIEPIGSMNEVIVYDFKTGKPKSRGEIEGTTKNSTGDYKRQLVFYRLLLDKYQFKKMIMKTGVVDFVEPNDKGEYKREVFSISDEEVKALEEQIMEVTNEILSMRFMDKGCGEKDCEYCTLWSYMRS